jgi:PKD repeat protein
VAYTDVNTSGNTYQFTDASTGENGSQSYNWTVNGSSSGSSSSLNYTFSSSGTYTVCLYVTEPGGCSYTPYCKTITIGSCTGVSAGYSYVNNGGSSYTFTNTSTGTNGSQTYNWTVNNSDVGTGSTLNYTFSSAGTYNVCLTISQSGCTFAPYCQTITISSCPSVNVAYTYVNSGGYSYTFTDASTGENGTQTYAWTVNGSTVGNSSVLNYTFSSAGSYTVCLNVIEPGGCTYQQYCRTITIASCPNVTVSFTDVNNGGTSYTFTDASTGENGSQTYSWTVNGNSVGTGSTLNYTFSSSGTYDVCLNVFEPGGCNYEAYCKTISIGGCPSVVAAYTYSTTGGNAYTFTNASTGTNGSQTYQWTINSINVGTGSTLNYTFTSSATYDVCLNVAESGCTYAPYCQNFTITTCPNVTVSFNDQSNGGGAYTFTDASTGENGSQTATWTVNGSTVGTGATFNYTFLSTGSYNVCLDVSEPGGCNYSQSCRNITVVACPNVVAAYTYTNNGNNSYTFTDASTGENGSQSYNWTVAGTSEGTGSVLNYTFANTGTYTICLNVSEPGCTYTPYCNSVTISTAASVIITTYAATNVGTTSAGLNGGVTTNGTAVSNLSFNWGTTSSYGSTVVATPSSASSNATFSANLSGLHPNTTYYFQAVGTVSGISIYGVQQQFTTGVTGVPAISASNFDISVYPNPAGQQFTVNTHSNDTYILNLYNMIGQMALTQLITQPVSTVDVSTLANGIYNVVIEKDNTVKTYRLVVLNK